jgi:hypothetical protein
MRERLRQRQAVAIAETMTGVTFDALATHRLIDHFPQAELKVLGQWGAGSCGEATVGGQLARTILLHPPARLTFSLPTGAEGTLTFGLGMHPEVWRNPECGPCQFLVRVDGALLLDATINVRGDPAAWKWHNVSLPVTALAQGWHTVELETVAGDGAGFRWALWRDPVFIWMLEDLHSDRAVT